MDTPEDPNGITIDVVRKNYQLFYNEHSNSVLVIPKTPREFPGFTVTKADCVRELLKGALLSIPDQLFYGEIRKLIAEGEEKRNKPRNTDMDHLQKMDKP